jgi:hypothetical protein
MALAVDEASMQVTPVLMADLGVYALADGSAQLLSNGNYFFFPALLFSGGIVSGKPIEIHPATGTLDGTQVWSLQGPQSSYRGWRMPSLYQPPIS